MHICTHLIDSRKIELNAGFLIAHKGYLKEIILPHETAHQRNNRTPGRKRLYDPLLGIGLELPTNNEKQEMQCFFFLPLKVRSNLRELKHSFRGP